MNKTTWSGYIEKSFPRLTKDIDCEVLVIGGGICGILCAYILKEKGKNVVLLEKDNICSKKTLKTTATITAIEDLMYYELIDSIGLEKTKLYLEANLFALSEYKKFSTKFNFDFEECSSYKYSTVDDGKIELEVAAIKALGCDVTLTNKLDFPIEVKKVLELKNQGQMNPLKLVNELSKELEIYENSAVIKLKDDIAFTEFNKIKFKKVVVCTGFPFLKVKGLFFLKMYQKKSHVLEVFNDFNTKGNGVGTSDNDFYFRTYKDSILIGAIDKRVGHDCLGFNSINNLVVKEYNLKKIKNRWINIDAITLDSLPYIGAYTGYDENIFVATGFNMWGMTKSILAAHIISDLINEIDNKYAKLFSPFRKMPVKPLFKNITTALSEMLSFKKKRCKHLGCPLHYNEVDETYECRCHGSKYDKDGNIIDTPTQKPINFK